MACKSAVIAYPPPWYLRRSAPGRVRPARRRGPELTGAFPADVDPSRLPSTFAQVTALRPKAEMVDSSNPFWIPPPGTREGPRPAFPQVRGPLSTWWQVKDSNLRSFRDGFTDHRHQASRLSHFCLERRPSLVHGRGGARGFRWSRPVGRRRACGTGVTEVTNVVTVSYTHLRAHETRHD